MKFILTLFMCSLYAGECMPPHQWPERFKDSYDCMQFGYEEAHKKMEEIARIIGSLDFEDEKILNWLKSNM